MNSRHKSSGFLLVELCLVTFAVGVAVAILIPAATSSTAAANRLSCAANLRGIGIAIATYATKYNGHYPTVYQYFAKPSPDNDTKDYTTTQKWADDPRGYLAGTITASNALPDRTAAIAPGDLSGDQKGPFTCNLSCLYLLVRTGDAANENIFLCQTDPRGKTDQTKDPETYWSFHFIANCSYSFQNQLPDLKTPALNGGSRNTSQNTIDPMMVVVADMNPSRYFDPDHPPVELAPATEEAGVCTWNSPNHHFKGQNCLYGDGHVAWTGTPFCGYSNTNIWTRGGLIDQTDTPRWYNAKNSIADKGLAGKTPIWTLPYGGAPTSGPAAGTGDKYNSFLVP